FKLLLPCPLSDHNVPSDLLRIAQKLTPADDRYGELVRAGKSRGPGRIAVSHLVEALDEIAGFLELYREEESSRGVHTLPLSAGHIRFARGHVLGPELEAVRVRLAIQQVVILLTHEHRFIVNWIAERFHQVVDDLERGRRTWAESGAAARV